MPNIWFSSDLHFNHNRQFIYQARGFETLEEMNQTIIERFNSLVKPEDDLYLLGDTMLGKLEDSKPLVAALNGKSILLSVITTIAIELSFIKLFLMM